MQPRERDLGGAGQIEVVGFERVDVRLLGREEAGPVHRLLAHEHRRQHRHVALGDDARERPTVERSFEQRGVADQVAEARARQLRAARSILEAADLGGARAARRRVAPAAHLARHPPRCRRRACPRIRRVRHLVEQLCVTLGLRRRELGLGGAQLLLDPVQLLELLGRRLALQLLPRAQLVDLRHERAPALVGGEHRVEALSGAPLRASAARISSGSERAALKVDHRFESRSASITCATPSSEAGGQIQLATAFTRSCAFSTATP